jgi:maleylpyruvate isomerase
MDAPTPAEHTKDAGPTEVVDLGPAIRTATQRLVRTVDALPDDEWAEPSLLPGWSRAHVVAHLALNAEALAGVLEAAVLDDDLPPMYPSAESRDLDIEATVAQPAGELRERLLASTTRFAEASRQLAQVTATAGADVLRRVAERHPGGPGFPVGAVASMRLREVEVHHADLLTGYTSADWALPLAVHVIEAMHDRPVVVGDVVVDPDDDPRHWVLGAGGPTVAGPAHALAWWLTGRPPGPEVRTTDAQPLPPIASW